MCAENNKPPRTTVSYSCLHTDYYLPCNWCHDTVTSFTRSDMNLAHDLVPHYLIAFTSHWTFLPLTFPCHILLAPDIVFHVHMADDTADVPTRLLPLSYTMTTPQPNTSPSQLDDPTSPSYIPRMARMVPNTSTVHTISIKKITYPLTSRPDELWMLERTEDGRETWKPVETFLENLNLTRNQATICSTANQWRQFYDVPIPTSSSSSTTSFPVLPHPEHPEVHVSQPFDAIPDHLHILQSCWGRSAQHHSQGNPISLSWPPWRSTPPSSTSLPRPLAPTTEPTLTHHTPGHDPAQEPDPMDMSDSSVWPLTCVREQNDSRFGMAHPCMLTMDHYFLLVLVSFSFLFGLLQLWLLLPPLSPWPHVLPDLIHIALHLRLTHLKGPDLLHGSLEEQVYPETLNPFLTDPFWP